MRSTLCMGAALGACWLLSPSTVRAQESADSVGLRFGLRGQLGLVVSAEGVPAPPGTGADTLEIFSAGFGPQLRVGVVFAPWFVLEAFGAVHTGVLVGDVHAGVGVEVAPHRQLSIGARAAVGSLFVANFAVKPPSADFAAGVLRVELRFPERDHTLVFQVEGLAGATIEATSRTAR